ncbi:metal ABC transporter ATP-binding protein [Hyphomicrobium sp.]|uniref:metal ABC transporter ATP-binding protein n=1 Tax=Hyphomicrobium sp. TaxID=82 RepID=UPI0025BF0B0E|nr:metal ABC transporter ATP-binding protein [Hyphomicrobium sp.]
MSSRDAPGTGTPNGKSAIDAAAAPCSCGHSHGHQQTDEKRAAEPDPGALISARGVTMWRGSREVLSDIDVDVRRGEIVTLIGPNGAGKTTLVRILLGIEHPERGRIIKPASTRIGYVPQRFEVDSAIPMTVESFLALGEHTTQKAIKAALEETGAAKTINQQLSKLSGGETQRVLIARALLRKPNLLILDEPASGVDFTGEADLYDLIGRLRDKHNLGVLLVSHDLHVVMARSDRVICLNAHVCCSGKPEDVSQHAAYARIFGPQAASVLGVYRHHHDHRHDLTGEPKPLAGASPPGRGS